MLEQIRPILPFRGCDVTEAVGAPPGIPSAVGRPRQTRKAKVCSSDGSSVRVGRETANG